MHGAVHTLLVGTPCTPPSPPFTTFTTHSPIGTSFIPPPLTLCTPPSPPLTPP